jgi:pimeloyl-ACP methyl ester carboxylesterase
MKEILVAITAPTLILKADAQGELRRENDAVARLLPRGRIVHVDGAGHCVRRDRPEVSLKLVREFLAEARIPRAWRAHPHPAVRIVFRRREGPTWPRWG